MTFHEFVARYGILIGVGLGLLWRWEQSRKRNSTGTPIDTNDPLWRNALEQARTSLSQFRELVTIHPAGAAVKYAIQTSAGVTEHVWGLVISFEENLVTVSLETPPIQGKPVSKPPYNLQLAEIEDWQVQTTDGRIFGSFTVRAQIAYARKNGYPVPSHMLEIEKQLVDSI